MYINGNLRKEVTVESMFTLGCHASGRGLPPYLHGAGRAAPRSPPGELRQHRHRRGGTGQRAGCRAAATSASCRVIVVGDHKQLGRGLG